jgi:hypothetical protein
MKTFFHSLLLTAGCLALCAAPVRADSTPATGERGFYTQTVLPTNGVLQVTNNYAAAYSSPMLARMLPTYVALISTNGAVTNATTCALSKVANGITVPTWTNAVMASNTTSCVFLPGYRMHYKTGDILVLTITPAPVATNLPIIEIGWE